MTEKKFFILSLHDYYKRDKKALNFSYTCNYNYLKRNFNNSYINYHWDNSKKLISDKFFFVK